MIYGYCRVSTDDQSLDVQREALKAAGCDVVRGEKASGKSREGRHELEIMLEFLREGDTLIVCKLDRLARNTIDMLTIIEALGKRGVGFRSLAEPWADTTSPASMLILTVMAGVAEFERRRIHERITEGIKRARRQGKHLGRPKSFDAGRIRELHAAGNGPASIARQLGCDRATVYRALAVHAQRPANLNGHE